ncbi:MAG: hypothetical protein JSU73_10465 [candidate division WOR-3 bacterium]|nr:MAG: hypothetical protein JSU73_10465 [candidate division WOR-3 bacterium]
MTFLLSLLAAKGLGALIGGLLLITQHSPGFASPELVVRNDTVYVKAELKHGFNKNLDQLLESGSLVAIAYTATVFARDRAGGVVEFAPFSFYHSAVYEPGAGNYTVFRSELSGGQDSLSTTGGLELTKDRLTSVMAPVYRASELPPDFEYSCRIEGALNTIELEGTDGKELDLNVFWNYRYPRGVTPWTSLHRR